MSEEIEGVTISTEERSISTREMDEQPERMEEGEEEPTSAGSLTEMETPQEEIPVAVSEVEQARIRKGETEQIHKETKADKSKRKRKQTLTYLSSISKQVERNGTQIHRIAKLIQSLHKQGQQTGVAAAARVRLGHLQSQSIRQVKSQLNQLERQVSRIDTDIQKIRRTAAATKSGLRKQISSTTGRTSIKPKSKKSKTNKIAPKTKVRIRGSKSRT
ncbi:MAG: hypothetical protein WA941_09440 [Nitrososphaeraceae archaeon]